MDDPIPAVTLVQDVNIRARSWYVSAVMVRGVIGVATCSQAALVVRVVQDC